MLVRIVLAIVVHLLIAPPLSSFAFFLLDGMLRAGPASLQFFDLTFVTSALPFAWLIAWPAALIVAAFGVGVAWLARWEIVRLLAALPCGAAVYVLLLGWLVEDNGVPRTESIVALAGAGALAALVCAAILEALPVRRGTA